MKITVYQVDSFTSELFTGNPAGVVTNADNLSEEVMQKIARELNNSETAFIINRPGDGYDIEVRFFTPSKEVPICGHATVAAHYIYAKEKGISSGTIMQKTGAGILPVEISSENGDLKITMTQAKPEFGAVLDSAQKQKLTNALNINQCELDDSLPVQIVSTGHSKVMIPLKSESVLDSLSPKSGELASLSSETGCNGFYTFTFDTGEKNILVSGRMFAPAIGIYEDPVTGNANGPLGAYLTHYGRLEPREQGFTFRIKQGQAMNRTGCMDVHVFSRNEKPHLVKISGMARTVFRTEIEL